MFDASKVLSYLRARWEAAFAIVLVAFSLGTFVWLATYIDRPIVDDAAISIAYGRSLVDGDGLRVTPYSPVAEGFSNPTWMLFLGLCEKVGINSMRPAKWVGFALAALALPLLALWGPISQQRKMQLEDACGPLLACTNASLVYWALGGLEIGLLLCLAALFGVLLFAPRTRRTAIALGVTTAALVLTRPEALLYVAGGVLPWLADSLIHRRRPTRLDGLAVLVALGIVGAYLLFREVYFGSPLPNTYYAKRSWFVGLPNIQQIHESVIQSGSDFYTAHRPLFIVAGIGVIGSIAGGLKVFKTSLVAAFIAGATCFFFWYAYGDWMKEWRFLVPAVPFLAYPVAASTTGFRSLAKRITNGRSKVLAIGAYSVLGVAVGITLYWTTKIHESRWLQVKNLGGDTPLYPKDRPTYGQELRRFVMPFKMSHPLIAGPDMGWMSLGMRDAELIDLGGLTNMTIARQYSNPNALRDYFANEGYPTLLMVWGPSNNLYQVPGLLDAYHAGPGIYRSYMIFNKVDPASDDRCPDGKEAALQDTPSQMTDKVVGDLRANEAVKALARWRCYLTYRRDEDMPTAPERLEIAQTARALAAQAEQEGNAERALRDYSLCAVIGASSFRPSVSCRLNAERLRRKLFPGSRR